MILTCPECATRYFVGDEALPAGGRTVRCANCGASWRAWRDPAASGAPSGAPNAVEVAADDAPKPAPQPAPVSKAFRAQAEQRRRTRQAITAGVVWAAASVVAVVFVLSAVLFRVQVVRMWPRTAGAYALLRLPVNPTGLALDGVQGQPGLMDGKAVLAITGLERNVEARARAPSALRVSLYDKVGRLAAVQVVRLGDSPIGPGEARPFRAVFTEPPLAATEFGVELAFDLPPPATPAHPALRPASVTEAQPLPDSSPYALPAPTAAPHG